MRKKGKDDVIDSNAKWSNYGCYCLPSQAYTGDVNWVGRGTPVDEIDHLCQKLHHCYQCTARTYAECPASSPYAWLPGRLDTSSCADEDYSCKGALCRCDVDFSVELAELSNKWNKKYSQQFGFDRVAECGADHDHAARSFKGPLQRMGGGSLNVGSLNDPKCCGRGLNSIIYHPNRLECCKDGSTKAIGACDF